MPKKNPDSYPKRDSKTSSIPYKKFDKKEKNPLLVAAAKKMFDRTAAFKEKKAAEKSAGGDKPERKNYEKKSINPRETIYDAETIYAPEEKLTDEIRLNKYLSHAGVASRRAADELIKEGRVKVNGTVVKEMGHKVKVKDNVTFDGKTLSLEKKYYLLLNKPKDYITTLKDEKDRKTVMELLRGAYEQIKSIQKPRLYPVGRLDRNTTGVLLITNDGELALHRLPQFY